MITLTTLLKLVKICKLFFIHIVGLDLSENSLNMVTLRSEKSVPNKF